MTYLNLSRMYSTVILKRKCFWSSSSLSTFLKVLDTARRSLFCSFSASTVSPITCNVSHHKVLKSPLRVRIAQRIRTEPCQSTVFSADHSTTLALWLFLLTPPLVKNSMGRVLSVFTRERKATAHSDFMPGDIVVAVQVQLLVKDRA